ncbi:multidrug resistance protein [bacterium]|nr:multidrug resistance protein [bacterium]
MDEQRERNIKAIPMILVFTVLVVAGQLLLKYGLSNFVVDGLGELMKQIFAIIFNPFVFIGLALYVVSTGVWLIVLSRTSLSFCYPFISISYILIIITSRIFFNEIIDLYKVIAIVLIIAGVFMLSMSRTEKEKILVDKTRGE